jgi:SAM-dependent methyltransferase
MENAADQKTVGARTAPAAEAPAADEAPADEAPADEVPIQVLDEIRSFWDADAPTYDNSPGHHPQSPAVMAAWTAALQSLLPPGSARVLDVGAGTGFLSLIAARLGHKVTAVDLSPQMLEKLERSARREGLAIDVVVSAADKPPEGFDAVMERHLLWTLPDPGGALESWRRAVPDGRLLLVESIWGRFDPIEKLRELAVHRLHKLRRQPPDHHSSYSDAIRKALPLGGGTPPSRLVEMVEVAGWRVPRLERLRDIEWAERFHLPLPERLLGVSPRFVVVAE